MSYFSASYFSASALAQFFKRGKATPVFCLGLSLGPLELKMSSSRGGSSTKMEIESLKRYFDEQFTLLPADMATKTCIKQLGTELSAQNEKIQALEERVADLENCIKKLTKTCEVQEQ